MDTIRFFLKILVETFPPQKKGKRREKKHTHSPPVDLFCYPNAATLLSVKHLS